MASKVSWVSIPIKKWLSYFVECKWTFKQKLWNEEHCRNSIEIYNSDTQFFGNVNLLESANFSLFNCLTLHQFFVLLSQWVDNSLIQVTSNGIKIKKLFTKIDVISLIFYKLTFHKQNSNVLCNFHSHLKMWPFNPHSYLIWYFTYYIV